MAEYKPPRSASWRFDPKSKAPYRMSRSGLELFVRCPNCFYIDKKLGVGPPPIPSFTLNSAVDHLLKKEFDIHRAKDTTHPLLKKYGVDAKPVKHEKLETWRNTFKGINTLHKKTNIEFYGGIDDLWINSKGEYIVVDYKATSKEGKVSLDGFWQQAYKRQLEIYQWILRQSGFKVAKSGYFVYCNGKKDLEAFDGKLEFDIDLIEHVGDDSWVEPKLIEAKECLMQDKIPAPSENCELCRFKQAIKNTESQDKKETDKDPSTKKSIKYIPTQLL
ncbi:MAG: PD-(D/E)XK nuclease family protein [bacterium]